MAHAASRSIVRQIESLFEGASVAGVTDRHLLERFTLGGDAAGDAAFAALVTRYGPMVLRVCRQLLGDRHYAEDAFQAVFFVLAREARSIRDPDRLGPWLYGVAIRTARKARARLERRRRHEESDPTMRPGLGSRGVVEPTAQPIEESAIAREEAQVLHDEIERLPRPFRLAVILCYFEGLTLDEAARRLRCPAGTLRSRLARAREKLRRALTRRGFALSTTALAAALSPRSASASVSPHLCDITASAAIQFAIRPAVASTASTLALEVLRTMTIHKLRTAIVTFVFLAALATGGGYLARSIAQGDEPRKVVAAVQPPASTRPVDAAEKPAPGRMFVVGRVLDPQGKPVPDAAVMVYAGANRIVRRTEWDPSAIGQARSDGSGRFRIDAPRTSGVRHWHFGAVAIATGFGAGWSELNPDAEQPVAEVHLRPEQVIRGRVFDLQGRPAQSVQVSVQSMGRVVHRLINDVHEEIEGPQFRWSRPEDLPAWPRPVTTDAQGRFTVRGIGRELRAILEFEDPRFALQRITIDTDATSDSKPVTLGLEPARTITGRATYADTSKPVPHARILVGAYNPPVIGTYFREYEADVEGRFRVNPLLADRYSVYASPPDGQPYLGAGGLFAWPKGAVVHSVDWALPRGVLMRGKVTESGSGKPLAGARVTFAGRSGPGDARATFAMGNSEADGSFQLTARPGTGYLAVLGPTDDYVFQSLGNRQLSQGQPGGLRLYSHAFLPYELKPDGPGVEASFALRRGITVSGQVVDPDGQPVQEAWMLGRVIFPRSSGSWHMWVGDHHGSTRDGHFEIHGLDPDAETPISFYEPKRELGATVSFSSKSIALMTIAARTGRVEVGATARFSGESPARGPVTVRLEPCGTAKARLVDRDGKPVPGYHHPFMISMVVTPGPHGLEARQQGRLGTDSDFLGRIDPAHYVNGILSDAQGRITLPALIPGATYRISERSKLRKEFAVRPGESLDLGDILIENPQAVP
jgi:RNA polymerase sigma factor (sigma-70 family)